MSAEYSLEEVRAHARMLRECRINTEATRDRQQDKLADICDAYADLLERIKADEGAVPVATLHADGFWTWKGTPPHESNHAGWRMDVFAHPPAQAAQPEPADAVSDEGDQLTVLIEHLTKVVEARHARGVPKLDAEDWAVLQRLRNALPDVGLNGWHRGVTVLSKLLAAAPSPGESE